MIKHVGNIGDGAVRDLSVEGLPEPEKIFGRAKFDMGMNERRLISQSIAKKSEF